MLVLLVLLSASHLISVKSYTTLKARHITITNTEFGVSCHPATKHLVMQYTFPKHDSTSFSTLFPMDLLPTLHFPPTEKSSSFPCSFPLYT